MDDLSNINMLIDGIGEEATVDENIVIVEMIYLELPVPTENTTQNTTTTTTEGSTPVSYQDQSSQN